MNITSNSKFYSHFVFLVLTPPPYKGELSSRVVGAYLSGAYQSATPTPKTTVQPKNFAPKKQTRIDIMPLKVSELSNIFNIPDIEFSGA